jgi:hypothetical protein
MGNPQPTLLVPAARFERVTGMGEDKEHSRFTLVAAGGAKSRGVAFGSPPRALAPAADQAHDIALRLERNRWKGMVEPRVILRALCPTEAGQLDVLGEDAPFWDELGALVAAPAARPGGESAASVGVVEDRRGEGFAGVAGDLFSSGETVLVAVADVPRRRAGLEAVVAGLSDGAMPVTSWGALAAHPELAEGFDHLVALDPPPGGGGDPLLRTAPRAHLAWGPAEAEFAITAWRAELDLRPQLTEVYRALRALPAGAAAADLETALRGPGRYPRNARACARLARVLGELSLIVLDPAARTCRVLDAARSDLQRSETYRASGDEMTAIERALASARLAA